MYISTYIDNIFLDIRIPTLHKVYTCGASFIRTLWFPVKIVRKGEASGYPKCYDLSLKKKNHKHIYVLYNFIKDYTKDNYYILRQLLYIKHYYNTILNKN